MRRDEAIGKEPAPGRGTAPPTGARLLNLHDSFRFECTGRCGGLCCRTRSVRLDPWDVLRLARGLGRNTGEILSWCAAPAGALPGLRTVFLSREGAECPLLGPGGRCSVHPWRPLACRLFPVREEGTVSEDGRWRAVYMMSSLAACPGRAGEGPVHTLETWLRQEEVPERSERGGRLSAMLLAAERRFTVSSWMKGSIGWEAVRLLYDLDGTRDRFSVPVEVIDEDLAERTLRAAWLLIESSAPAPGTSAPPAGTFAPADVRTTARGRTRRLRAILLEPPSGPAPWEKALDG